MKVYATTVIWLTSLILPYLIFMIGNSLRGHLTTGVRAALAIGAGWIFTVAYAISANAMSLAAARSDAELHAMFSGDGAALAFSAVFGWVGPALVVGMAWLIHGWAMPRWRGWTG